MWARSVLQNYILNMHKRQQWRARRRVKSALAGDLMVITGPNFVQNKCQILGRDPLRSPKPKRNRFLARLVFEISQIQCIQRIATTENVLRNLDNHSAQKLQSICSLTWDMILQRDLSSGLHLESLRVLLYTLRVLLHKTGFHTFSFGYILYHVGLVLRHDNQSFPSVNFQPPQIDTELDSTDSPRCDSRNAIQTPDQSQSKMTSPTTWAIDSGDKTESERRARSRPAAHRQQ